jgi:uncharacterized repeat protein (TIGR03803 family)
MTAAVLPAQTFRTLHSFNGTDGTSPEAALVQATNGNLYGTTTYAGANADGTAFKITANGAATTLHSFDGADGSAPYAGLIQATNGTLYGTTQTGGTSTCLAPGCGTVFKITASGVVTTLHSFDGTDGEFPLAPLVQATNGTLYGTTQNGGANGAGTIFKITPGGTLTTLYSFCSQGGNCTDGTFPYAGLVQGTDGNLYGTTSAGGGYSDCNGQSGGCGTVFKITPSGTLTRLYSLRGTDGAFPWGLIQATDGNLYGTTLEGGANDLCNAACGTVFKITLSGTLTTLHNFCSESVCADGASPYAGLVQGTDGNLYGTTEGGGANSQGTLFKITTSGALTTLHSFVYADGDAPLAGLIQNTNGKFYGTTSQGGANGNYGTVFSLSVGLGPFIETNPTSGKAGKAVKILGTNLTGATSVTFNGTAATFTVKSKSEITTTVPTGATTGTVQVVTPGGTLSSNVPFRVTP